MMYLKPVGGLCNRMRSIDSALRLCEKHNRDLTILWVKDQTLNCSFNKIFCTPTNTKIKIDIIDCPKGFPESFVFDLGNRMNITDKNGLSSFQRKLKMMLKPLLLSGNHRNLLKSLTSIPQSNIVFNNELFDIYASKNQLNATVDEMDSKFLTKAIPLLEPLVKNTQHEIYVESCYRMFPKEHSYSNFIPIPSIEKKIELLSKDFNNTFGLHVRRTDHVTSIENSSTQKFINVISERLTTDPDSNFFLATDDGATKKELIDRFGDKIMTNDITSFDRNREMAIVEAVIDLYCLSKTTHIYGSHHSTFSQTAADIGGINETTVR